jgi:hypothetical protein
MAGAVLVIVVLLFVAPLVLGSFAVVQKFSDSAQVAYFGVITAFFVVVLIVGAVVLVLNPV